MKIQFTAEEISEALKEYCLTYKGLKISDVELGVNADEYGGDPDQGDFWATADFKIIKS